MLKTLEKEDGPWKKDVQDQDAPEKASSRAVLEINCDVAMLQHPGSLKDRKEGPKI